MKHILHTSALMGLVMMLAGAVVVACQKDNPEAGNPPADETISAAPFTLTALEDRGAYGKLEWTISKTGKTDSVSEELDEMTVTSVNTFTFTAEPEKGGAAAFPGINVKSSNTAVVMPSAVKNNIFTLKYVGDGEATITVWNGTQTGQTSITFKVISRQVIEPKALRFIVDGKIVDLTTNYETEKEAVANRVCILTLPKEEFCRWKNGETPTVHKIVFQGLIPENCSYDMVSIQPGIRYEENWKNWLIEHNYDEEEFFPEAYASGGAISKLKGKVSYNACGYGSNPFKATWYNPGETRDDDPLEARIKVSVRRNPTYAKHYACYVKLPDLQKIQ